MAYYVCVLFALRGFTYLFYCPLQYSLNYGLTAAVTIVTIFIITDDNYICTADDLSMVTWAAILWTLHKGGFSTIYVYVHFHRYFIGIFYVLFTECCMCFYDYPYLDIQVFLYSYILFKNFVQFICEEATVYYAILSLYYFLIMICSLDLSVSRNDIYNNRYDSFTHLNYDVHDLTDGLVYISCIMRKVYEDFYSTMIMYSIISTVFRYLMDNKNYLWNNGINDVTILYNITLSGGIYYISHSILHTSNLHAVNMIYMLVLIEGTHWNLRLALGEVNTHVSNSIILRYLLGYGINVRAALAVLQGNAIGFFWIVVFYLLIKINYDNNNNLNFNFNCIFLYNNICMRIFILLHKISGIRNFADTVSFDMFYICITDEYLTRIKVSYKKREGKLFVYNWIENLKSYIERSLVNSAIIFYSLILLFRRMYNEPYAENLSQYFIFNKCRIHFVATLCYIFQSIMLHSLVELFLYQDTTTVERITYCIKDAGLFVYKLNFVLISYWELYVTCAGAGMHAFTDIVFLYSTSCRINAYAAYAVFQSNVIKLVLILISIANRILMYLGTELNDNSYNNNNDLIFEFIYPIYVSSILWSGYIRIYNLYKINYIYVVDDIFSLYLRINIADIIVAVYDRDSGHIIILYLLFSLFSKNDYDEFINFLCSPNRNFGRIHLEPIRLYNCFLHNFVTVLILFHYKCRKPIGDMTLLSQEIRIWKLEYSLPFFKIRGTDLFTLDVILGHFNFAFIYIASIHLFKTRLLLCIHLDNFRAEFICPIRNDHVHCSLSNQSLLYKIVNVLQSRCSPGVRRIQGHTRNEVILKYCHHNASYTSM